MSTWVDLLDRTGIKPICKFDATVMPVGSNDIDEGYGAGSRWLDVVAEKEYTCVDPGTTTLDNAVWVEVTGAGPGGEVNDLDDAVTWPVGGIPSDQITEDSVTLHEGAIEHDSLLNADGLGVPKHRVILEGNNRPSASSTYAGQYYFHKTEKAYHRCSDDGAEWEEVGVPVDDVTLEVDATNGLQVKALGVDTAQIAADAVTEPKLATTGTPDGTLYLRDDMQWTAVAGGGTPNGWGQWQYDDTVTDSDPGAGVMRYSTALTSDGSWYIDDLSAGGLDFDAAGAESVFAYVPKAGDFLRITKDDDDTVTYLYRITTDPTDSTGYWEFPCTYVAKGAGTLVDPNDCSIAHLPKGSFTLAELSDRVSDQDIVGDLDTRLGAGSNNALGQWEWKSGGTPTTDPTAWYMTTTDGGSSQSTKSSVDEIQISSSPDLGVNNANAVMATLRIGDKLVFNKASDSTADAVIFTIIDTPEDKTGWWNIPVSAESVQGTTFTATENYTLQTVKRATSSAIFSAEYYFDPNAVNWCVPLAKPLLPATQDIHDTATAWDSKHSSGTAVTVPHPGGGTYGYLAYNDPLSDPGDTTVLATAIAALTLPGYGGYVMPRAGRVTNVIVSGYSFGSSLTISWSPAKMTGLTPSGSQIGTATNTLSATETQFKSTAAVPASANTFAAGDKIVVMLKTSSVSAGDYAIINLGVEVELD